MKSKSIQGELARIINDSKLGDTLQKHYLFKDKDGGHDTEMYEAEVNDLAQSLTTYFIKKAPEMVEVNEKKIRNALSNKGVSKGKIGDLEFIRDLAHTLFQAKGVIRRKG